MKRAGGNDISLGKIVGTDKALLFPRTIRDKHLYVAGATGTGKSKFLEHLIRQDIRSWFKSRSGLLLLDPHGSLYDSLLGWLAKADVERLPIIPIDLRQNDWVISYNALRKRPIPDCSVIIDNFVQAMAHVWGQSGTDDTPRFARWATNILRTLYENDLTLLEAEHLIDHLAKEARHALLKGVTDRASRRDWEFANQLKPREFEAEIGSTANRLHRFLRNQQMRTIFGQSDVSLDLGRALEEGHIILVSLASAGAKVSEEDADLFATLLLSDLWTAALERGKKPGVKPFYVYLDECQRFVTPTIARNLDEARGFGLHLTMANQYPQQLFDQNEQGMRLYHSIMENASSKVVFRLQSEENLRPLAQWLYMGVMNTDEIKLSLQSTKVMDYIEEERTSCTTGTTRTSGESNSESSSEASGASESVSESRQLDGSNILEGNEMRGSSSSVALSSQRSSTFAESESESNSETVSSFLRPVMGKEASHVQFRSLEEQLHRSMAALFDQKQRQGVARLAGMKAPVSIFTPTVLESTISPPRMKAYVAKLLEKWDFAVPALEASRQLAKREKLLEEKFRRTFTADEPETSRRRIVS